MEYKKLALELIKSMPMPGKARNQNMGGGLHSKGHVLLFIDYKQDVLPKDIADALGISSARVATILNKLSDDGLISREINKDDRRQINVRLTDLGITSAKELKDKILIKITAFLEKLGENDAKEYVRIMGRLAEIKRENDI